MEFKLKNIPTSLNDCSVSQLIHIIKLSTEDMSNEKKKIRIFFILIENQGNIFDRIRHLFYFLIVPWYAKTFIGKLIHDEKYLNIDLSVPEFDLEDCAALIEDISSMFFDSENTLVLDKIPEIVKGYFSPGNYFENLDFQTFRSTDVEFYDMLTEKEQTGEINISDRFIRCLYQIPWNIKIKIADEIRQIILMYYIGNRKQLEFEFPYVFKKSSGNSNTENYEEMWENILDAIAEKPQFYNDVDTLNVRSVLKSLNRKLEINEKSATK